MVPNTPSRPHWSSEARHAIAPANDQLRAIWELLWDVVDAADSRYGVNPSEYHRGNQCLDDALGRLRDLVEPA